MKCFDRIVLTIVGLFLVALAAGCVLLAIDYVTVAQIVDFISTNVKMTETIPMIAVIGGAVVFLIFGLKILFMRPKKRKITACTIMKNEGGEACVSLTAIDNTVKLAMATFDDVKESKIAVRSTQNGVIISARVAVPTGIVIPQLLDNVRAYLKSFTEEHTGITVANIRLVATEYKQVDPATEKKKIAAEKKQEERRAADEKKAEEKRSADEKKAEDKRIAEEAKAESKKEKKQEPVEAPTHARLFVVAEPEEAPEGEEAVEEATEEVAEEVIEEVIEDAAEETAEDKVTE